MTVLVNEQYAAEDIPAVAQRLVPLLDGASVILLRGTLGAGKTTLTKKLLETYGVSGVINSPTYAYVNRYQTTAGRVIYHFDLYRVADLNAFLSQGFDELVRESGALSLIEWPGVIEPWLFEQQFEGVVYRFDLDYVQESLEKRHLSVKKALQSA